MLGALIFAALLAPDTDNNLTYQALPLLLVLLVAAVCLSRLFKAPFAASRVLPRFGTAGCPLNYQVLVKNLSRRGQNGLSLMENLAEPGTTDTSNTAILCLHERTSRMNHEDVLRIVDWRSLPVKLPQPSMRSGVYFPSEVFKPCLQPVLLFAVLADELAVYALQRLRIVEA